MYAINEPLIFSHKGHLLIDAVNEIPSNEAKIANIFLNCLMKYQSNNPFRNILNSNVLKALKDYFHFIQDKNIIFSNTDYRDYLLSIQLDKGDFIYLDPPYLISGSEYNKLWNENLESCLYELLEKLDSQGIAWGLSNLLTHKGKTNTLLQNFAKKYSTYPIQSNYISFNDNSIKKNSVEVYITNVK